MSKAIPIIAAAGALILISNKKSKRSKGSSSIKWEGAVDESDLDEQSKDDLGDFETDEEDISLGEDEDGADAEYEGLELEIDPQKTCEEFMRAVHVIPEEDGDLTINEIAVDETVLPAMRSAADSIIKNMGGPLDEESVGPALVLEGLRALVPVCEWKYDPNQDEFTYDNGKGIESQTAKDVLFGLITISIMVIEEANNPKVNTSNLDLQ